jgi:GH24 family phage-related lysozyme (muramidase)
MNSSIGDPVGSVKLGAKNRTSDVKTVQGYLNIQIIKDGRSDKFLDVTGDFKDDPTLKAIIAFQHRRSLPESGLIEPRDRTWDALSKIGSLPSMKMSLSGETWLKNKPMEDYKDHPYVDNDKNTTIGWGHKLHSGPPTLSDLKTYPNGINNSAAENFFRDDVATAEKELHNDLQVPLTQNQFDALVSFVFNIGITSFRHSTIRKVLNDADYVGAAKQFDSWRRGHETRRTQEQDRFRRR